MRPILVSAFVLGAAAFLVLFTQGCEVKQVVNRRPPAQTPPNALQIETEVEAQLNQIAKAQSTGDLEPPMAVGLAETDGLIRRLSLKLRASNPSHDLTVNQAAFLESLLNGNNAAIDDALQRRDAWVQTFEGGGALDSGFTGNRLLYIAFLQYNLKDQENTLHNALGAGSITPDQAQLGISRVQSVRDTEISDFTQNRGLDLKSDEILELQQMSEDSARFIRFLLQGTTGGTITQDSSSGNYPTQAFANTFPANPGSTSGINTGTNAGTATHYWDGRPVNVRPKAPTANPTPTVVPLTATSTPVPPPTATPIPTNTQIPPPSNTPTPIPAKPTPSPTPVPQSNSTVPSAPFQPPSSNPAAGQPAPPPVAYLSVDPLKSRDKQLDQLMDALHKQGKGAGSAWAAATQIRKAFHQALKNALKQNQQKGITQEQMSQLSKILDDLTKAIADLAAPTPTGK